LICNVASGDSLYVTLRGPNPLSGNNTNVNNAKGLTPGLGVIRVEQEGMSGTLQARFAISNLDGTGVERARCSGLLPCRRKAGLVGETGRVQSSRRLRGH